MIGKEYPVGSQIPSEGELSDQFDVSRTTIREAVKSLCARNVLEIRRGVGTFVKHEPGVADDPFGLRFINIHDTVRDLAEFSYMVQPMFAALAAMCGAAAAKADMLIPTMAISVTALLALRRRLESPPTPDRQP